MTTLASQMIAQSYYNWHHRLLPWSHAVILHHNHTHTSKSINSAVSAEGHIHDIPILQVLPWSVVPVEGVVCSHTATRPSHHTQNPVRTVGLGFQSIKQTDKWYSTLPHILLAAMSCPAHEMFLQWGFYGIWWHLLPKKSVLTQYFVCYILKPCV